MAKRSLDFNFITDQLLIGKTPKKSDYTKLKDLGVTLVINMRAERYAIPIGSRRLIKTIWVPTVDSRFIHIRPNQLIKAVNEAVRTIKRGGKVYVYCFRGRHRSVLMSSAILIAEGYSVEAAVKKIKSKRLSADPGVPHIYRAIVNYYDLWNQKAR